MRVNRCLSHEANRYVDEKAWREFVASKRNKLARLVKAVCAEFLSLCPLLFIGGLTTEDTEDAEERPPITMKTLGSSLFPKEPGWLHTG